MARIRSVKPELRTSLTAAEWPREVRYFWVLLWGYLDDEGRGADVPKLIMSDCFPMDEDLCASDIDKWLDLLATPSPGGGPASICRYTVAGRSFLHAPRWKNHQRPQHPTPSKYPPCNRGGDCGAPSRDPHESLMSPHEGLSGSFRSPRNVAPTHDPGASPQATDGPYGPGTGSRNAQILHLPSSGALSCGPHEDLRNPHESRSGNAMLHAPSTSPSTKAVDGEVEDQKPSTSEIAPRPSDAHPDDQPAATSGASGPRDDVARLCAHLADRIEANGSKRPAVSARWRDAARLMLDRDGRTEEHVRAVIDWCQDDTFWKANILSMPKLREQFDRLRLQAADRDREGPGRGQEAYRNPDDQSVYDRGFR